MRILFENAYVSYKNEVRLFENMIFYLKWDFFIYLVATSIFLLYILLNIFIFFTLFIEWANFIYLFCFRCFFIYLFGDHWPLITFIYIVGPLWLVVMPTLSVVTWVSIYWGEAIFFDQNIFFPTKIRRMWLSANVWFAVTSASSA